MATKYGETYHIVELGIRNHSFEEIYSTCNGQKDTFSLYCIYWCGLLEKKIGVCFVPNIVAGFKVAYYNVYSRYRKL